MQVKEVNGFEAEVLARAVDLVAKVVRRHAMHAADDIFGIDDSALDVLLYEIAARIGWQIAIEREIACLGAYKNLVTLQVATGRNHSQGGAQVSLRSLMTVINGGVEHVDTRAH